MFAVSSNGWLNCGGFSAVRPDTHANICLCYCYRSFKGKRRLSCLFQSPGNLLITSRFWVVSCFTLKVFCPWCRRLVLLPVAVSSTVNLNKSETPFPCLSVSRLMSIKCQKTATSAGYNFSPTCLHITAKFRHDDVVMKSFSDVQDGDD